MRTKDVTKPSYDIIFKKFAKKGDGTLLKLDNFFQALEYLAMKLHPDLGREEAFTETVNNILESIV